MFVRHHRINLKQLSRQQLRNVGFISDENYFSVEFEKCLKLIRRRKCLLINGNCYVRESDLIEVIVSMFRRELRNCLVELRHEFDMIKHDNQFLIKILQNSYENLVKKPTTINDDNQEPIDNPITSANIHILVPKSFPPCMFAINAKLIQSGHIKVIH